MYIGKTAKKILEIITERLDYINKDKGLEKIQKMKTYTVARKMKVAEGIKIKPLVVDHSALDAYMFLIEAGGKKILFTGDFRDHGIASNRGGFEAMINKHVGEVDILITEGTMLSRCEEAKRNPVQTEEELRRRAYEIFSENHENVVLVSSTNLDSMMEFYHAVPNDKAFVCDEYQAEVILAAIKDKGEFYPKRYCLHNIGNAPRNFYIVGRQRKLGKEEHCYHADWNKLREKGFVMLARPNRDPKRKKGLFEGILEKLDHPKIIYSMWEGYLKPEHEDKALMNFIKGHEDDMISLHTSGHAYVETIAKLIGMTNPKVIIPMHTECADDFAKVAEFAPYKDRVMVLSDGEKYCIDKRVGSNWQIKCRD
jgi:ribonuclease J